MAKINWKTIGVLTTIAGGVLALISNTVEDKKMEETIKNEVDKALAERLGNEEDDEEESY